MTVETKKFTASFSRESRSRAKRAVCSTFYSLAKKHIVKGKRGGSRDLSKRIDEIAYGI